MRRPGDLGCYGIERDDDEPEDKEKAELYRRVEVLEEDLRACLAQRERMLVMLKRVYDDLEDTGNETIRIPVWHCIEAVEGRA